MGLSMNWAARRPVLTSSHLRAVYQAAPEQHTIVPHLEINALQSLEAPHQHLKQKIERSALCTSGMTMATRLKGLASCGDCVNQVMLTWLRLWLQ